MRPVALGRKNALFAGADSGGQHWALVPSQKWWKFAVV
jgi:hypothetical protein